MVTSGRSAYVVGVDLGQKRDYSAVAVLELGEHVSGRRDPVTYELMREAFTRLVYLERVELGPPYPDVVTHIAGLVADDRLRGCTLVVDATGVGAPVVDLLKKAQLPCRLMPVTITGGCAIRRWLAGTMCRSASRLRGCRCCSMKGGCRLRDGCRWRRRW